MAPAIRARIPGVYWTGAALAAALALPLFAGATWAAPLLRLAGEPPALVTDVVAYLHVLRWGAPAGIMGIGLMRVFLPAAGLERALMWVVPSAVGLNLLLNRVLIWGVNWGGVSAPAFGMRGSAAATAISLWVVTLALLALLHGRPSWRGLVGSAPAWRCEPAFASPHRAACGGDRSGRGDDVPGHQLPRRHDGRHGAGPRT